MNGRFRIVVLACSAGGLDAVSRVLGPLPKEFPAAVIVVQHLTPTAPVVLPRILAARTVLPVESVVDGAELTPGRVVVAPPGQHLLVTARGTLAVFPAYRVPPYRPSADLLLATLAAVAGPRVVAVVLSGRGNDGATGATAVHHCGGVVLATDPATAAAAGMPQATINRDTITDSVLDVDDIAEALVGLTAE